MKKVTLTCPNCGYTEPRNIEDDESLEGLACPNCEESLGEEEAEE